MTKTCHYHIKDTTQGDTVVDDDYVGMFYRGPPTNHKGRYPYHCLYSVMNRDPICARVYAVTREKNMISEIDTDRLALG